MVATYAHSNTLDSTCVMRSLFRDNSIKEFYIPELFYNIFFPNIDVINSY